MFDGSKADTLTAATAESPPDGQIPVAANSPQAPLQVPLQATSAIALPVASHVPPVQPSAAAPPVQISNPALPAAPDLDVLSAHKPPPTAAFAIPLSLVAAIVLAASCLFFRHRRQLRKERTRDAEKFALSRGASFSSSLKSGYSSRSRRNEVEHALDVLARNELGNAVPVPLFMPRVEVRREREPRRSTRAPFPREGHAFGPPPSYAYATPNDGQHARSARYPSSRQSSGRSKLYTVASSTKHGRPSRSTSDDESGVTHSVLAEYLDQSSPVPPTCLLSAPQRLHVRNEAAGGRLNREKPLPRSPQRRELG